MTTKAIILVAGMGTRLKPLTQTRHKCLTKVDGKEILGRALHSLACNGISQAVLVTGYLKEQVQAFAGVQWEGMPISYAYNDCFLSTGTSASLCCGLQTVAEYDRLLILEGDVVFEEALLRRLLDAPSENTCAVERYRAGLDGTFMELDASGCVSACVHKSRQGSEFCIEKSYKTVNMHLFSGKFVTNFLRPLTEESVERCAGTEPLEYVLDRAVRQGAPVMGLEADGMKWAEIDDLNDLEYAESLRIDEGVNNTWHDVWERRRTERDLRSISDHKELYRELMMLDGYDIVEDSFQWDELKAQFDEWTAQMGLSVYTKAPISSVFEVGCGSGPNLMLYQRLMGLRVGGVDYSRTLLDYAKSVVDSEELYCGQAAQIDPSKKYDVVMSFSVFHYFPDYAYAKIVLRKMIEKAERTVAVLAVHDQSREEAFYAYRRALDPDYDERYRDTPKLFYSKEFFIQLAEETGCDIKFTASRAEHYWNRDFIFNVYLYINPNWKRG